MASLKKNFILLVSLSGLIVFSCKKSDDTPSNNTINEVTQRNTGSEKSTTIGTAKYVVGYTQTNSNNQDAYALKEVNGTVVWSKYYDRSPDDSKSVAVAVQGDDLFVALSCTGGNTDFRATQGAFQGNYGSGGGPAIIYLARLNAQNGEVLSATFLGCKLTDGKTNTLRAEDGNITPIKVLANQQIEFRATKAYDKGDGRLTPNIGNDADCNVSGGKWVGVFNYQMALLQGDCLPN